MTSSIDPPDLAPGETGEWVSELQRLLTVSGHMYAAPTGVLDDDTVAGLASFQVASGLPIVDHVDATTWLYLRAIDAPAGHDDGTDEWHWDGTQWVSPADVAEHADSSGATASEPDESNWHWDGYQWQPGDTRGQDA